MINININGETKPFNGNAISYGELMLMTNHDTGRVLSVTYHTRRNGDEQLSGIMHPGCEAVRVEEGMVFNVADTSNA